MSTSAGDKCLHIPNRNYGSESNLPHIDGAIEIRLDLGLIVWFASSVISLFLPLLDFRRHPMLLRVFTNRHSPTEWDAVHRWVFCDEISLSSRSLHS